MDEKRIMKICFNIFEQFERTIMQEKISIKNITLQERTKKIAEYSIYNAQVHFTDKY